MEPGNWEHFTYNPIRNPYRVNEVSTSSFFPYSTTYYETVAIENSKSNLSPDANGVGEQSSDNLFDSSSPKLKSRSKTATSDTAHRINIRMIDRPDFHLAISGKTWAIIKEHYPWLIPKVCFQRHVFCLQDLYMIESCAVLSFPSNWFICRPQITWVNLVNIWAE